MKSFLAKRGVKEEILSFDARRISNQSREQVERLLQQRSNSFDPNVAKKASAAAAPLAIWYRFIMQQCVHDFEDLVECIVWYAKASREIRLFEISIIYIRHAQHAKCSMRKFLIWQAKPSILFV
jgi:hypothetical protein